MASQDPNVMQLGDDSSPYQQYMLQGLLRRQQRPADDPRYFGSRGLNIATGLIEGARENRIQGYLQDEALAEKTEAAYRNKVNEILTRDDITEDVKQKIRAQYSGMMQAQIYRALNDSPDKTGLKKTLQDMIVGATGGDVPRSRKPVSLEDYAKLDLAIAPPDPKNPDVNPASVTYVQREATKQLAERLQRSPSMQAFNRPTYEDAYQQAQSLRAELGLDAKLGEIGATKWMANSISGYTKQADLVKTMQSEIAARRLGPYLSRIINPAQGASPSGDTGEMAPEEKPSPFAVEALRYSANNPIQQWAQIAATARESENPLNLGKYIEYGEMDPETRELMSGPAKVETILNPDNPAQHISGVAMDRAGKWFDVASGRYLAGPEKNWVVRANLPPDKNEQLISTEDDSGNPIYGKVVGGEMVPLPKGKSPVGANPPARRPAQQGYYFDPALGRMVFAPTTAPPPNASPAPTANALAQAAEERAVASAIERNTRDFGVINFHDANGNNDGGAVNPWAVRRAVENDPSITDPSVRKQALDAIDKQIKTDAKSYVRKKELDLVDQWNLKNGKPPIGARSRYPQAPSPEAVTQPLAAGAEDGKSVRKRMDLGSGR